MIRQDAPTAYSAGFVKIQCIFPRITTKVHDLFKNADI